MSAHLLWDAVVVALRHLNPHQSHQQHTLSGDHCCSGVVPAQAARVSIKSKARMEMHYFHPLCSNTKTDELMRFNAVGKLITALEARIA